MGTDSLKKDCLDAVASARAALEWVNDTENEDIVGADKALLTKELRRDEIRGSQLALAVDRPMSIGVFGPSQAGKSYLVSVLAASEKGNLKVDVGDGMDFISEINPAGDKESTGLVTRFTMRRHSCPAGFPVVLKLLSEADVIRILANTFFRDGDNSEPPPTASDIAARIAIAQAKIGTGAGLSEMDVWDIQSYFDDHFRGYAYAQQLGPLWEGLATLLPHLTAADRLPLVSLLWGEHAIFNELYERMASVLSQIGHAETAYAAVSSLTPRAKSIIDVATLEGLDNDSDPDPIRVRSQDGVEAELPRAVLAALTAELVLPMAEKRWDLFDGADLLDFPGVRERRAARGPIRGFIEGGEKPRKELFLRGKVGFLFERYVAQQDMTAMLLCLPPSNIDVAADLAAAVEAWIASTQGATPEERAEVETLLFFVLTKFDMHLQDSAGSKDPRLRFESRIQASLLGPFAGQRDSWPLQWAPGRVFDNTYWLRNPNYAAEHVIRYEESREVELLENKIQRIGELKQGCLSSPLVKQHIADPDSAWEAALELNDGGITRLAKHLERIATPSVKERQIAARLRALTDKIARRLKPYYSDSDIKKRLDARRAVATTVVKELRRSFENRRFTRVIEEFGVHAGSLAWRMDRLRDDVQIVTGDDAQGDGDDDGWGFEADSAADDESSIEDGVPLRSMTLEAYQAETAINAWHAHIQSIAEQSDVRSKLHVSAQSVAEIANELSVAARRLRLSEHLTQELAQWNARQCDAITAASITAQRINDVITTLGVDLMAEDDRPVMKNNKTGETRQVFAVEPVRSDAMDLAATPPRRDRIYFQDWTFALYSLFESNARSEDGGVINIKQNSKLGRIIEDLDTTSNAEVVA